MSDRFEFVGLFEYNATVLLPRRRTPARVTLFGRLDYSIAAADRLDDPEAVIYERPRWAREMRGAARPLSGHDGRLWRPMTFDGVPAGRESYLALMDPLAPYPHERHDAPRRRGLHGLADGDPLVAARPRLPAAGTAGVPLRQAYFFDEEFDGQVLWTDRLESAARHHEAARHLLVAGDALHVRASPPRWSVHAVLRRIELEDGTPYESQHFRLDRRADAEAFFRSLHDGRDPDEVSGRIVRADPAYVLGDDIAYAFRHIDVAAATKLAAYAEYLPPEATAALGFLLQGARRSGNDIDGVADPEAFAGAFRTLSEACRSPAFPPDMVATLTSHLGLLDRRMTFERDQALTPAGNLSAADAEALGALAEPRR